MQDPETHNLYAYCANNSINYTDPSGHSPWGVVVNLLKNAKKVKQYGGKVINAVKKGIDNIKNKFKKNDSQNNSNKPKDTKNTTKKENKTSNSQKSKEISKNNSQNKKVSQNKNAIQKEINFTKTTQKHMNNPNRHVPIQTLRMAIKSGKSTPDPRGSNARMYYTTMYKNGKQYNLEVLYDKKTNTIMHFEYSKKSMGPLPKITK